MLYLKDLFLRNVYTHLNLNSVFWSTYHMVHCSTILLPIGYYKSVEGKERLPMSRRDPICHNRSTKHHQKHPKGGN